VAAPSEIFVGVYYIKNQQDATLAVFFIAVATDLGTSLLDTYHPDPWHAPVAATTDFSTPDDGRRKRQKHVE